MKRVRTRSEMIMAATADPWTVYAKPNQQTRLRLFCIPYAGGSASIFRMWSERLPTEVAVYPIQLPGRETRLLDPPFTRLEALIPTLAQALLPHFTVPFAFFGHSMGALISFELARYLRDHQAPSPIHIFASGRRAPQIPSADPPIYHLPEAEFLEELRHYNGTPDGVLENAELMQVVLPALRADFTMLETYVYRPAEPLACSISAFGGMEDRRVSEESVAAWREQTRGAFRLRMLPGDHFFLHSARESLLQHLAEDLNQILQAMTESQHA
jgi:surfactin synthase thioesterase subunit